MLPLWVVVIPGITALCCLVLKKANRIETAHLIGGIATATLAFLLVRAVASNGPVTGAGEFFYVDALSAIVISIIAIIGLTAALHSIGYLRHERGHKAIDARQFKEYYVLYHLFISAMLMVCVFNNMGLLWVSIEATTIITAFLVALHRKGESLEAAWKYLMICGVGIAIALLGIILLYTSAVHTLGASADLLNWSVLRNPAIQLQPAVLSLAFALIFVGLGTKIGFAPLHFWLPDAHSQAPSPISALLSGVLLNCALLVLIRFAVVASHAVDTELIQQLFIGFGMLSILVALPFMIVQRDLKRLLAFSTVENMGIIAVAIGFGGLLGYTAALLQMFNHSMTKSLLFLTAGNVTQKYGTKQMARIAGLVKTMPFSGLMLIMGTLSITGLPPFNLFTSKFAIITTGFTEGHAWIVSLMIAWLAFIFGALVYYLFKMSFGTPREKLAAGELSRWSTWPLWLPFVFMLVFGLYIPRPAADLLRQAAAILTGG